MPSYENYTKHFNKAKVYTYNYKIIDDAIVEAYNDGYTIKMIANALREPQNRIVYRIQVLLKENKIQHKYDTRRARILRGLKSLQLQMDELKAQL